MSIQHVDSSVKCQHAIQINCGLEVKIWTTRTSEQQPAMRFQLPPPSMQHICSNVIWQTIMTKSLCSQSNGDHKPFWSFICTDSALLFSLSTHIWAVLWKAEAFFLGTSKFPACIHPPHPDEQPQYVPPQVSERNRRLVRTPAWSLSVVHLCFDFMLVISPWSRWPRTTRLLPGGTMPGFQDFGVHWEGF